MIFVENQVLKVESELILVIFMFDTLWAMIGSDGGGSKNYWDIPTT